MNARNFLRDLRAMRDAEQRGEATIPERMAGAEARTGQPDLGDGLRAALHQAHADLDTCRAQLAALRWQQTPHYTSEACQHSLHGDCGNTPCRYCGSECACGCHGVTEVPC